MNTTERLSIIRCSVSEHLFGVPATQVSEVIRIVRPAPLPKTPAYVQGVFNLRGRPVFAVDLRKRFRLPAKPYDQKGRILICPMQGVLMGFMVDEVHEVEEVSLDRLVPEDQVPIELNDSLVFGVLREPEGLLVLANLEQVFNTRQITRLKQVQTKSVDQKEPEELED